ncbi:MAG TPA: hypothetical protein VEF04_11200, partial [Blastocatellia bacterium]|nr:hypothetical protein [Blastocatellia bacterium]
MLNSERLQELTLVSGYFTSREGVATYSFHDSEKKIEVKAECHVFVPRLRTYYMMLVLYENDMTSYFVTRVVGERPNPPSSKDITKLKPGYNETIHCEPIAELRRLFNVGPNESKIPYQYICYLRDQLFEKLVYNSRPFQVQPDVLALWIGVDHPLVQEARVLKAITECTKRERSVWLKPDQLRVATRIAKFEDIKNRMIRKKALRLDDDTSRLALEWAAQQADQFKKLNPRARFI